MPKPKVFDDVEPVFTEELLKQFPDIHSAVEVNANLHKALRAIRRAWERIYPNG